MSARRLAIRQPKEFALSAAAKREISTWVKKYPKDRQRSALIPAMWIAQKDAGGWLPELALRELGDMLDMAYIRVYEVATFYTMFNLEPVGTHFVQLCGQHHVGFAALTTLLRCLSVKSARSVLYQKMESFRGLRSNALALALMPLWFKFLTGIAIIIMKI